MKFKIVILILALSLFIFSCNKKTEYTNEIDSCKLNLYNDSTYRFIYPTFLGSKLEKGVYEIRDNKITLSRKSFNKIDSVKIGYTYSWNGTDKPDSLAIRFKNLNNENIKTRIKFNNSTQEFESNELGQIDITYKKLEDLGILKPNEVIKDYIILFEVKTYNPDMTYYLDSRRPRIINFKLNQFVGEDYALLKRVYRLDNDTIYINDISRKSIGKHTKLVNKKWYNIFS